jgi:hypothetical protein
MSFLGSREEPSQMNTYKCQLTEDALYHVFMRELHLYYKMYVCLRDCSDGDEAWWTGEVERTREAVFAWLTEHPWLADRYDEDCVFVVGENVFSRGVRFLMIAAYYQDVTVIERASREGWGDVNATNAVHQTALHYALVSLAEGYRVPLTCDGGGVTVVGPLIDAGLNLNGALHAAVSLPCLHSQVVSMIADRVDVNARDEHGRTALMIACALE